MSAQQPEVIEVTGVARRYVYAAGGKVAVELYLLDEQGRIDKKQVKLYLASKFAAKPGYVYTWKISDDGTSYYPKSVTFVRSWGDPKEQAAWYAEARAFQVAADTARIAKQETTRNLIEEQLAPLREAYWATNHQGRIALKALVLHYLEHGQLPK